MEGLVFMGSYGRTKRIHVYGKSQFQIQVGMLVSLYKMRKRIKLGFSICIVMRSFLAHPWKLDDSKHLSKIFFGTLLPSCALLSPSHDQGQRSLTLFIRDRLVFKFSKIKLG